MLLEDAHAVAIGISQYQRVDPLRRTEDAPDLAAVLRDAAYCGYPAHAVHTLLDDQATRAGILDALDALARTTRESSTVFVYYSGHGGRGGDSYYLLPVDAAAGSPDELARTAISSHELSERLRAIPASRLTVVLDCCRAGELATPRLPPPPDELTGDAIAPLAHGRGRAVIAASRASGAALALPGDRNSVFTGYLLDGLRGAASGVGGVIRICDLFHYVQQRVAEDELGQYPVFRAELEENYPLARLRGGAPAPFAIPPPPDRFRHDALISYRDDELADRAWVESTLLPALERRGLAVCYEHRDFRLGAPRIDEIERAVIHSRYTVAVFTPAYLDSAYDELHALLAAHVAVETRAPRLIPLVRRPCELALHARMTEVLDVSDDAEVPAALDRLALALRQPPRSRLGG